MSNRHCFLFFMIGVTGLLCGKGLTAQNSDRAIITGQITCTDLEEGLPSAHVRLMPLDLGVISDSEGFFEFVNVPPGTYQVLATYLGYEAAESDPFELGDAHLQVINLQMEVGASNVESVVVTAARRPQTALNAPASVQILDRKEIQSQNLSTFDQALDQAVGVQVTRSSAGNIQTVSIRGASEVAGGGIGNRVLLLIDGRPSLSPESGGALWNLVPLQSVDRIEVVKGAYSSLFGSSAMGGVINVITKTPDKPFQFSAHANHGIFSKAPAYTGYDERAGFYNLSAGLGGQKGNWQYILDGGLRSNDGHREKSGFDMVQSFGKLTYKPNSKDTWTFSGNFNRIKNDAPATWLSTRQAYQVADHRKDDYQDRREFSADLNYQSLPNAQLRHFARAYYYSNFSEFSFNDDPEDKSDSNVNFGKQTVDIETVETHRWGGAYQMDLQKERHYLSLGADLKSDYVDGVPDTVLYGEHRSWTAGIYVQDEISLGEMVNITAGVRYDHFDLENSFTESRWSPKIAAVYQPTQSTSFRMLFAQAFRNPSIAERFIKFEQGGGLRFRPNPTLRAEKLNFSYEAGFQKTWSRYLTTDLAVYYNKYRDLISFRQVATPNGGLVFEVINLNNAVMQGVEFTSFFNIPQIAKLRLTYTYLDARDISEGRQNDHLAYKYKHALNGLLTSEWGPLTMQINGRYRSAIKEVFIYPGNEPAAYTLFGGKISYAFSEMFSTYLSIDNINNTQYEELERYRMPGRSFTLGFRLDL